MGKLLEEIWPRHKLSFRDAINTFVHHILGILLVPKFLWGLPITYMRKSKEGYDEFGGYLQDLINRERLGKMSNRQNLLSMLIKLAITTDGMSSGTPLEQRSSICSSCLLCTPQCRTRFSRKSKTTSGPGFRLTTTLQILLPTVRHVRKVADAPTSDSYSKSNFEWRPNSLEKIPYPKEYSSYV